MNIRGEYTNWKGVKGVRNIVPLDLFVGSTECHPEEQLLVRAFDLERHGERTFAFKDFTPAAQILVIKKITSTINSTP